MAHRRSLVRALLGVLLGPAARSARSLMLLRARALEAGHVRLARLCTRRLQRYGMFVALDARVAEDVVLPHPTGIVVGSGVVVHSGVRLYQNVTLGGARVGDGLADRYPVIGEGTVIFAGAVVAGDISIGRNCVIGANAVVLASVPDDSVCVGVPGRVVDANRPREV